MIEIERQEMKDYNSAKLILSKVFGKYYMGSTKLEQYSPVDMSFSAATMTDIHKYGMEIKSTPKRTYLTNGFILKVSKYINMMKWGKANGHNPYIIYLCTDLECYYIFDLSKIVLSMDNLEVLNLKLRQYDQNSPSTWTAVIKLKPEDAILIGEYNPGEATEFEF